MYIVYSCLLFVIIDITHDLVTGLSFITSSSLAELSDSESDPLKKRDIVPCCKEKQAGEWNKKTNKPKKYCFFAKQYMSPTGLWHYYIIVFKNVDDILLA